MKHAVSRGMLEATRLTRTGRLAEATALLRRMLAGTSAQPAAADACAPLTIDGVAEPAEARDMPRVGQMPEAVGRSSSPETARPRDRSGPDLRDGLRLLRGGLASPPAMREPTTRSKGGHFLKATFSDHAGSRPYALYVPTGYDSAKPVPLIVMLHGCTQSPEDFAAGTRMNEAAEAHTCLVVYPGQTKSANLRKCWNWFSENDQRRDGGEPSLIAGITRKVMRDYAVDPRRVYVAGLSAGGAAAAIMADAYPDLYAAAGVHSGLACGAAHDMASAFTAMHRGGAGFAPRPPARSASGSRDAVPIIIFHGDRDTVVNPRNGDAVAAQYAPRATLRIRTDEGNVPGGYAYSRRLHEDGIGRTVIEQWVVHGGGHAWFGGSAAGSFTDPKGPDATKEMLRFFLEHPRGEGLPTTSG